MLSSMAFLLPCYRNLNVVKIGCLRIDWSMADQKVHKSSSMSHRRHHVITTSTITIVNLLDEHHAAHTTICGGTAQTNKSRGLFIYADIIDDARLKRIERLELKQRHDSATKLQEWWRGVMQNMQIRKELRFRFEADVLGIDGMRCLVLLNKDEEALGIWSRAVLAAGSGE